MPKKHDFVICIRNSGNEASLEIRKIYETLSDPDAERDGMVRVIDESGEDYLFPADFFVHVDLPSSVERAVVDAEPTHA
jgi:hypothetical protein